MHSELKETLINNDAVIFGILLLMLAFIFKTSNSDHPSWKKFYKYVPMLLLCYFLPSLLNSLGIAPPEWVELEEIIAGLKNLGSTE